MLSCFSCTTLTLKSLYEEVRLHLDKLLVVGSTGLVGSKIVPIAQTFEFEASCTFNTRQSSFPRSSQLDVTDRDATLKLVRAVDPEVIINSTALTNVDYCETHKAEAERVNVGGARNLADAARDNNCRLVQISTDSVFDGTHGHYTETDIPHPINHYSNTKLASEEIVSDLPNFAIARPSVVYGWRSEVADHASASTKAMNFAMFVLEKLNKNETVSAITDQYSSPTLADNLADALLRLARARENGIFHTAGRSCLSRYEFAILLCRSFGHRSSLVQPVSSNKFKQVAERPRNSCLQVEKAEKTLGIRFLTAEEGIAEMRRQSQRG